MSEEKNIEESQEDGKSERPEEVNENISPQETIRLNSYDATSFKLKQMEDWENKVLYEQAIPKAGEMFNFRVFDDLRNNNFISHEMYVRNINEQSIDILLNQAIVIKHLRERELSQQKELLQKTNEILNDLQKDYHLENE